MFLCSAASWTYIHLVDTAAAKLTIGTVLRPFLLLFGLPTKYLSVSLSVNESFFTFFIAFNRVLALFVLSLL